jgi:hypothetical protein
MANIEGVGGFKKGRSGNPNGRPRKSIEERYTKAVYSVVKADEFKAVIEMILKAAKRGDMRAAKLILDYTVGTPVQKTELTGRDGGQIEFGVQAIDYRLAITPLAPRSVDDSDSPGESESPFDGETLG